MCIENVIFFNFISIIKVFLLMLTIKGGNCQLCCVHGYGSVKGYQDMNDFQKRHSSTLLSDSFGGQGNSFHGTSGRGNKKAQMRHCLRLMRSVVSTDDDVILQDMSDQGAITQLLGKVLGSSPSSFLSHSRTSICTHTGTCTHTHAHTHVHSSRHTLRATLNL
jgi:hypothetical protein